MNIYDLAYMTSAAVQQLPTSIGLFGAFADETRLRILNLLCVRELCVCDVSLAIATERQRHLAILRDAGLVQVRRQGKWKFYSVAKETSPLQLKLLGCVASCLAEIETLAADRKRLAATRVNLRCR